VSPIIPSICVSASSLLTCLGIADAYDLAWKIAATIKGWGGDSLLDSYDTERRQIAYERLATVQHCLEVIVRPLIANFALDKQLLNANSPEGDMARKDLEESFADKHWFHAQNGNILGYQYVDSPLILTDDETEERPISKNFDYYPTTWPGSRAPHVWLEAGKSSILDLLSSSRFNLIDFSADRKLGELFIQAGAEIDMSLNVVRLDALVEGNARRIYDADVLVVRPDGHVAWRMREQQAALSKDKAVAVLKKAAGR
jgi:FAD-dependent monooxygenase